MKKLLLQIACLCLSVFFVNAQDKQWNGDIKTWEYDLNGPRAETPTAILDITQTEDVISKVVGDGTPPPARTINSTSASPQWFPAPSGASTQLQIRLGGTAIAKYTLIKKDNVYNSLKIDAANALNKFLLRDIDDTKSSAIAKFSFTLKTHYKDEEDEVVIPGAVRTFDFLIGNNTTGTATSGEGAWFRGGDALTTAVTVSHVESVFASFRLASVIGNPAMTFTNRKVNTQFIPANPPAAAVNGAAVFNTVPGVTINADGTEADIELYCNNSAATQYYVVDNEIEPIASQTVHLWVNGTKIETYVIDKTQLSVGKTLSTFSILSTGTADVHTELGYGAIEISDLKVDYATTTSSLPVSLSSFSGKYNGNSINLNWQTVSEKENSHFEVLRSGNGITFSEIARKQGANNSTEIVNYTITDNNPLTGVNYYQLKQVDNNGEYTLSEVIAVNAALKDNLLKVVKKDGGLGVSLYSERASAVSVYVTDMSGRKIYSQKVQVSVGNNQFDLSTLLLVPGIYVLSVEGSGEPQRIKFVN